MIGDRGKNSMSHHSIEDIYNFLKLSDAIATSGQPTEEQFLAIRESGYQIVVNLALPESPNALPDEKQVVEAQGMQYKNIPVVWDNPTLEDVAQFFSIMEDHSDKNIFVHCAANMRVSAFMYLYRRIHKGMSDDDARKDLEQIWLPNETWQKFIEQVVEHYQ
ncbi:protein tyrosine phosphatase family protein [Chroococcidiopsis sp. CCMEE 29]|uniref:protein tyrosine phosphatase family protein n=1 Tax=Chroococcidiopsis sp. CCMEE 29 TaxID=155894 RepID=UPI0020204CE5|nr:protein tyrosine phosphatase family protein [Chroococcidiopsis sp. CCMEE 29]